MKKITITSRPAGELVLRQYGVYNAFNTAIDPYRSLEQSIMHGVHTAVTAETQRLAHWKRMGEFYGYPQCCILVFLKNCCAATKHYYPEGPWDGTGFVPCMCCAKQAVDDFPAWVEATIMPRRVSADPFFPPT